MVFQLSKMAQAGVGMLEKQGETIKVIKGEIIGIKATLEEVTEKVGLN